MKPRLSILIATVGEREERFLQLVERLSTQVQKYDGQIEVLAFWNNMEHPIAEIRQALVDEATGEYVCFIDDDDSVPEYYCDRIMAATEDRPDYVGFRMQLWYDGVKTKPTYHSIRYSEWSDDAEGYYRNISHLNPIRRDIAIKVPFTGHAGPEDYCWSSLVAPLVHTEEYVEEPMYFYYFNSSDSIWRGSKASGTYTRPELPEHFRYHPDSKSVFVA